MDLRSPDISAENRARLKLPFPAVFTETRNEKGELSGKTVYSVREGALLICLEDEITKELIDTVAEAEPQQFICLDRGF